jgi:hypothetical protein
MEDNQLQTKKKLKINFEYQTSENFNFVFIGTQSYAIKILSSRFSRQRNYTTNNSFKR